MHEPGFEPSARGALGTDLTSMVRRLCGGDIAAKVDS